MDKRNRTWKQEVKKRVSERKMNQHFKELLVIMKLLIIHFVNGEGVCTFEDSVDIATNIFGASFVDVADIATGDAEKDDIVLAGFSSIVGWSENTNGDGSSFGNTQIISVTDALASGASCIATADFDNDEDEDLVYAAPNQPTVTWRKNDGNGNFDDPIELLTDSISP